jgi:hypothetical protein
LRLSGFEMLFRSPRHFGLVLFLVALAKEQGGVDAWSSSKMKTARPNSSKLFYYKNNYASKNQYGRDYDRYDNSHDQYDNNGYYNDYYENDQYRRDSYNRNNEGYGYNNVQYSGNIAPLARSSQNNQGYYDNQGFYDNQDYGYNNVQYSGGVAAPLSRPLQRWNSNNNDNSQIDLYDQYSYNEPYMRNWQKNEPIANMVSNAIYNSIQFSKDVDSTIDRMMTPFIQKSSRGLTGTLRKGMNAKMRTLAPEDSNMEAMLDEGLDMLRYDAYVVQDLLQADRRIELATDGQSVFSQYSTVSSEIINQKQDTLSTTKLGVRLNYYPWKMWIDIENGILQGLVLVNDETNFEYDVFANYDRNNYGNKFYLNGDVNYIDV